MREQAAEEMKAHSRQPVGGDEGVALRLTVDQRLMQMPAARHHVRQRRPAHEAREHAVAARDLLHRGAEQDHRVGRGKPDLRPEGELALARPELDLDRAQREIERDDATAQRRDRLIEQVEARLGEILIALREQADLRRFRRPGGVGGRKPRVLQLEQMEFHLEPGEIVVARVAEFFERVAIERARRERHRLAVGEIDVAQHPAGLLGPWQDAERAGIGDHHEVGAALHLRHVEAAAGGKHRKHALVRSVLGEQRRRHADAGTQRADRVGGEQRLAAQDAVLVGEREAHQFELVRLDRTLDLARQPRLIGRPQAVAIDEGG